MIYVIQNKKEGKGRGCPGLLEGTGAASGDKEILYILLPLHVKRI